MHSFVIKKIQYNNKKKEKIELKIFYEKYEDEEKRKINNLIKQIDELFVFSFQFLFQSIIRISYNFFLFPFSLFQLCANKKD